MEEKELKEKLRAEAQRVTDNLEKLKKKYGRRTVIAVKLEADEHFTENRYAYLVSPTRQHLRQAGQAADFIEMQEIMIENCLIKEFSDESLRGVIDDVDLTALVPYIDEVTVQKKTSLIVC